MTRSWEFAPGRFVLWTGERVRMDPSGAEILLLDYDVLTRGQAYACDLALLRLAVRRPHIQGNGESLESDDDDMAKRRSGPSGKPWTEEQYRDAGYVMLKLRFAPEDIAELDELVEEWELGAPSSGRARGEAVRRAITEARDRVQKKKRTPLPRHAVLTEQPPDESAVVTLEGPNTVPRRRTTKPEV